MKNPNILLNANRGFTLIELLVVIAIIGILSSVVLSNLGASRTKAFDAKVIAQMSNIRQSAELYYIAYGSYGPVANLCTASGSMFQDSASGMVNLSKSANYPVGENTLVCYSRGTSYAVSDNLASSTTYWCVDNTGTSKQTTAPVSTTTATAVCPS